MNKELLNDLAKAIFGKSFITLKKREMEFVRHQQLEYSRYQDAIRLKALPIMDKKKLSTLEYNIIRELFFKHVPLFAVIQGIEGCLENSRGTGRAIYSLAFFKAHVAGIFRAHLRRQAGSRIFQDPWEYDEWRSK